MLAAIWEIDLNSVVRASGIGILTLSHGFGRLSVTLCGLGGWSSSHISSSDVFLRGHNRGRSRLISREVLHEKSSALPMAVLFLNWEI